MAVFRFELKSDMRRNGQRISAAKHAEYIDRQGRYRDVDEKQLQKLPSSNRILGVQATEHLPEKETLLYSSPFGVIKQDTSGIIVSPHASPQTIAIAIEVARRIYGPTLQITGEDNFIHQALASISELNLDVKLAGPLNEQLQKKRKDQTDERQRFIDNGGRFVVPSLTPGDFQFAGCAGGTNTFFTGGSQQGRTKLSLPNPQHDTIREIAQRGWCLPSLSGGNLVLSGRNPDMLLSANARRQLQRRVRRRERNALHQLRWSVSSSRKNAIMQVADEIGRNLQKHLNKTFASSHVQYINRESIFEQRGGCIGKDHHLPAWANDEPIRFFAFADKFERVGGERYKEIVFSLPHELGLKQQQEIIDAFIAKHMQNHYFAYAIHDKTGAMSNGERHTHVHLMFSTREIDDIERQHERPPAQFFSRYNAKKPEKGGARKATRWYGKERFAYLAELRESFAMIQNDVLAKYNIPIRVDHRSLKVRRKEALASGNTFMAEILNRVPESVVGPLALLEVDNQKVKTQKRLRSLNRQHESNVIAKNFLLDKLQQEKCQQRIRDFSKSIMDIEKLLTPDESQALTPHLVKVKDTQRQIESLMDAVIWMPQATEQALVEFMKDDERVAWQNFKNISSEINNWQKFKSTLRLDELDAQLQHELTEAILRQIAHLQKQQTALLPGIRKIFSRLHKDHSKNDILKHAGNIAFEGHLLKEKLQSMIGKQEHAITQLAAAHKKQSEQLRAPKTYTAIQAADEISRLLRGLYDKEHVLRHELKIMQRKYISPSRARVMAENVFVHGEFKKLRSAERDFKKHADSMSKSEQLNKQKMLSDWRNNLEAHCQTPEAIAKIQEITAGILRKNAPVAIRYQQLTQEHRELTAEIASAKTAQLAAKRQSFKDRNTITYKATPAAASAFPGQPDSLTIGKALANNNDCAALVARSKIDYPDDWELLSESERDDLRNNMAKLM